MATKQEIKQRQCLLFYLEYYVGDIDGIWGQLSKTAVKSFKGDFGGLTVNDTVDDATMKAMKHAVAYGMPAKKVENTSAANKSGYWVNIKHFTRDEFRCPCGKCGGFPVEPKEALVRIVDEMREAFGKAVIIVPPDGHSGGSGVRCQNYNDSLKGSSKNSRHVKGKAVDFSAPGVSAATIESYLNKLKNSGKIRYWYKISAGSYHMDIE